MKKFCKLICMIMVAALCFIGCGTKEQNSTSETKTLQQSKEEEGGTGEVKEVTELSKQFQAGLNNFAYKIFDQLENGENIVLSPYSMAIAISMLDNGAEGTSKEEIEQMLGIEDLEDWNACVKYYMSLNKDDKEKLLTANSLWLSDEITLSENADEEFFNPVKAYYNTEKKQMALSSEGAMEEINQWVSGNTDGMIDSILEQPVEKDIKMILLNAVYFKGEWEKKFEKSDTQKKSFYGKDKTSEADMMCQRNTEYKYTEEKGIKAIELPYGNENIAMDIFIPAVDVQEQQKYTGISELFSNLSETDKTDLFTALSESEKQEISVIELPKFDLEYGMTDISKALQNIGMKAPFEKMEFSKISSGLFVERVLHKAKIEVDEEGSKAAAVTEVDMRKESAAIDKYKEFIVDQPFIFVIRDIKNDIILFMGSVQNLEE